MEGTAGRRKLGTIGCWFAATVLMIGGLVKLASPTGWPNDRVTGGLMLLAAPLLLPPVLMRIRERAAWMRPRWAPVLFAFLVLPVATMIGAPFTPTGEARSHLRVLAIREARQHIASGDFLTAQARLDRFSGDHDATVDHLLAEIRAARTRVSRSAPTTAIPPQTEVSETLQSAAAAYAERVETYWLPQARAVPVAPPANDPAFGKLLTQIDELVIYAADGSSLPLSTAQRASRSKFMTVLSDKQAKLLPAMRREYAKALDAKLFRNDIRVEAQGTTLTLTGGVFVRNANVEDMETELGPVVNRLRFRRIVYRWSPYSGGSLHYDLDPPSDRKLARWEGNTFLLVGN